MADVPWKFRITDPNGNVIMNMIDAQDRSVHIGLNKAGEASFVYPLQLLDEAAQRINQTVDSIISPGRNVLEVFRGNTKFFAGLILPMTRKVNAIDGFVTVKALGWLWLLSKRHVGVTSDVELTDYDPAVIIDAMISATQGVTYGDFGLIRGALQESNPRSVSWSKKQILEAINDFTSAAGGPDIEITPDKVYNIFYPIKGTDKSDTVIHTLPGSIAEIEEISDGSQLVNYGIGVGKGWGDQELLQIIQDIDSQIAFRRFEGLFSHKDVDNATYLTDLVTSEVNENSAIVPVYRISLNGNNVEPDLDDYTIGDFIMVKVNHPNWHFERAFRVFEIAVKIDEADKEDIDLVVGII